MPVISPQELSLRLGTPEAPFILDVRRRARFEASGRIVAGAAHCDPQDLPAFIRDSQPRPAVVYCVHGHQVSADAVALLRAAGWPAARLAGGFEGGEDGVDAASDIAAWRAVALPTIRKRADLGVTGSVPSRWVTRERPKIDRIACPWLIRRFIDPRARFDYVPTSLVHEHARAHHAVAFDIPDAPITHDGEHCSFDALLAAFDLHDRALDRLALIVRGADTDRLELAPQCAGLLALSLGLSARHPAQDHAMLDAAMPLYDALYAWCRLQVAGEPLGHDWRPDTMPGARA